MKSAKPGWRTLSACLHGLLVGAALLPALVCASPAQQLLDKDWSLSRAAVLAQARVLGHALPVYVAEETALERRLRAAPTSTVAGSEFRKAALQALTAPGTEQYANTVRAVYLQLPPELGGDATCLIVTGGQLGLDSQVFVYDRPLRYRMDPDAQLLHEAAHCRGHWLMRQPAGAELRRLVAAFTDNLQAVMPHEAQASMRDRWLDRYRTQLHEAYADMMVALVCCGPDSAGGAARAVASFRAWLYMLLNDRAHYTSASVEWLAGRVDASLAVAASGGAAPSWVDDEFARDALISEALTQTLPVTLQQWVTQQEDAAIHLSEVRTGRRHVARDLKSPDSVDRRWIDQLLARAQRLENGLLIDYVER